VEPRKINNVGDSDASGWNKTFEKTLPILEILYFSWLDFNPLG
jgi:hypothetical protein